MTFIAYAIFFGFSEFALLPSVISRHTLCLSKVKFTQHFFDTTIFDCLAVWAFMVKNGTKNACTQQMIPLIFPLFQIQPGTVGEPHGPTSVPHLRWSMLKLFHTLPSYLHSRYLYRFSREGIWCVTIIF